MIFSIGYQRLKPEMFDSIVRSLEAVAIDCRSVPSSRKPGFSRAALTARLGASYRWMGDVLGGRPPGVLPEGIEALRRLSREGKNAILLCMEAAPGDCHRHGAIAVQMLPDIDLIHLFDDEAVYASELQRALSADDDYSWIPIDRFIPLRLVSVAAS
jgi:uncharacterized protein (DUF488 family)